MAGPTSARLRAGDFFADSIALLIFTFSIGRLPVVGCKKKPTTVASRGVFVEIRFIFDKNRPRRRLLRRRQQLPVPVEHFQSLNATLATPPPPVKSRFPELSPNAGR